MANVRFGSEADINACPWDIADIEPPGSEPAALVSVEAEPWSRGARVVIESVVARARLSFEFFHFLPSRTLPKIAASAMTIKPTTHRLRAIVKNRRRNAIFKF